MSQLVTALQNVAKIIEQPAQADPISIIMHGLAFTTMIAIAKTPSFINDEEVQREAAILQRAVDALAGKPLSDAERNGLIFDLIDMSGRVNENMGFDSVGSTDEADAVIEKIKATIH